MLEEQKLISRITGFDALNDKYTDWLSFRDAERQHDYLSATARTEVRVQQRVVNPLETIPGLIGFSLGFVFGGIVQVLLQIIFGFVGAVVLVGQLNLPIGPFALIFPWAIVYVMFWRYFLNYLGSNLLLFQAEAPASMFRVALVIFLAATALILPLAYYGMTYGISLYVWFFDVVVPSDVFPRETSPGLVIAGILGAIGFAMSQAKESAIRKRLMEHELEKQKGSQRNGSPGALGTT